MSTEVRTIKRLVWGCEIHQFVALDNTTLQYRVECVLCGQVEVRERVLLGRLWCRFCGYVWEGLGHLNHDQECATCTPPGYRRID